jgi:DNA methyltransferase 1-associated protein 1 (DMAP1).
MPFTLNLCYFVNKGNVRLVYSLLKVPQLDYWSIGQVIVLTNGALTLMSSIKINKNEILKSSWNIFLCPGLNPIPTEEIVTHYNELRSDMVLLYELKQALDNYQFELQSLKHQYEAVHPGEVSVEFFFRGLIEGTVTRESHCTEIEEDEPA